MDAPYQHEKAAVMKLYFDIIKDYSKIISKLNYLEQVFNLPSDTLSPSRIIGDDPSAKTSGFYASLLPPSGSKDTVHAYANSLWEEYLDSKRSKGYSLNQN
ncbi:hypothetical protein HZC32_03045 [Candidatus Woesearchaeota archaeon]|nr:hypothetical protein [Candidatus Woesearchaeota archaeon]